MLDADAVVNNSSQKVGGSNAYLLRGELGRFVHVAISAMVYIVLLFWRPPVVCYGEAAIVKTARHVCA